MTSTPGSWIEGIVPDAVDQRFGTEVVSVALRTPRVYAAAPVLDASARLVATIIAAPGGSRLSTPVKLSVRVRAGGVLEIACACRHGRACDHVVWLLVDVAFHPGLRAALALGEPTESLLSDLPRARNDAFELRTIDERLAAWLPPRKFDEDWEIDVAVIAGAAADGRAALLLRHRRRGFRALVPARDVLASRLTARHRRLVELASPHHLDKNALVAVRGQASILAHLLKDEIGLFADTFKARARFAAATVAPRIERDGDRLVARWLSGSGVVVGDAAETFLVAGPFPYLWAPTSWTFHPVAGDVDLDAALGMARVPSLPLGEASVDRVGRALLLRGPGLGVTLPEPEVFGLLPLDKPTFELRLTGTPLAVTGELMAVYSVGKVAVLPLGDLAGRDADQERLALEKVSAAGLGSTERGLVALEDDAARLWQTGLAELRASTEPHFEVLVAESIAHSRVGPPVQIDVRVRAAIGWLEGELEFRAGALTVEKERMHLAVARSKRWIVLSDGSLARIAEDVAGLASEVAPLWEGTDKARLPPHQFGRIARWLELADAPDARLRVDVDAAALVLREKLRALATRPAPDLPTELGATLRPYQLTGLAWLQLLEGLGAGGLLADDMGLGKTLMTLAFLERWRERDGSSPTLVVCPTSVVGNWIREASRFTPALRVARWTGSERHDVGIEAHDLVVTTYGLLRRDAAALAKVRFRAVVLDEAQNIKNPAAATSRAARRLDARMRLALTGTPVENRLSELWSLMTFVNPGMLGTAAAFEERYAEPIGLRPDGAVAAELRAVVRPFVLRRTKAEVLGELPPKTEVERICIFGLRQKRGYDALALALREAVRTNPERRKNARAQLPVLTAILRLRQMACDPRLVDPEARPEDSAKRAAFLDLVRELVSEDRRALVFSQFVELLTLWREDLERANVAYEYLDGSTSNRDEVVERFQNGKAPLFLVSLKAGGAGLNLTAADTVIHCDPWWNPAAEDQATDRAHRIGQTRPVTVIRLVAKGTIEDKIALLKQKKTEIAAAILGPPGAERASPLGSLTDEDVDLLLGDAAEEIDDLAEEEPA